ncbi:MAG: DUF5670 family protein [Myxococcaceae bacterium]|nr:DUF5670 family protein [Myxococcaceae bacterium]MCI0672050.1 DUF5670 family protein [Myxococcaceae bacterium]
MNGLLYLAGLLFVVWLVAVLALGVTGSLIHLLLVAAVVLSLGWIVRRATGGRTPVF